MSQSRGRLASHGLIAIMQSWDGLAGHWVVGWFFAKKKQNNVISLIKVNYNGDEIARQAAVLVSIGHCVRCGLRGLGREVLARPFSRRQRVRIYIIKVTTSASSISMSGIHLAGLTLVHLYRAKHTVILSKKVAWEAWLCSVALLLERLYKRLLWGIDSDNLPIKLPWSTYSSYTLSDRSALFPNASTNFKCKLFEGWVKSNILVYVSAINSSIAYIYRK